MHSPGEGRSITFRGLRLTSGSVAEIVDGIVASALDRSGTYVTFVNPHSYNILAKHRGSFRSDLSEADVVYADGIGVVWAVRGLTGVRLHRVSFDMVAPYLFNALSEMKLPVYLVGGVDGRARAAADVLRRRYPGLLIAGTHHGFVPDEQLESLLEMVGETGAPVVIIGAGAPTQEHIAARIRYGLPAVAVITCGGYFDQVLVDRYYPPWAYPLKLNWLVRLYREPRRLWRRYLVGTPRFVVDSVGWRLSGARD
jgi:N-acetylglucosaminyldiphosphoundecaprenol N-acetyl-beta-D-mannosaminyltransferase